MLTSDNQNPCCRQWLHTTGNYEALFPYLIYWSSFCIKYFISTNYLINCSWQDISYSCRTSVPFFNIEWYYSLEVVHICIWSQSLQTAHLHEQDSPCLQKETYPRGEACLWCLGGFDPCFTIYPSLVDLTDKIDNVLYVISLYVFKTVRTI